MLWEILQKKEIWVYLKGVKKGKRIKVKKYFYTLHLLHFYTLST
jgi:hypothetical protein